MVAFAAFESVAACRACATPNSAATQPDAALPECGGEQQTAEGASSDRACLAGTRTDAKT
jgi:hypothetical protein